MLVIVKPEKKAVNEILQREGTKAIYREYGIMGIVRVVKVEVNDWGVKLEVETIATLKKDPLPRNFKVDAAWDIFADCGNEWHAAYVNWNFFFDEVAINRFIEKNENAIFWYEQAY